MSNIFKGTAGIKRFGLFGFGLNLADSFNNPGTQGLSPAEEQALAEQRQVESDRRRRQLTTQERQTRVALGQVGGSRALLYGGYSGTAAVPVSQRVDPATIMQASAKPAPAASAAPGAAAPNPNAGIDRLLAGQGRTRGPAP